MSTTKNPIVTVNKLKASLEAGLEAQKLLVIGQKLATGTATEKTLITDVEESQISTLFGERSALGCALRAVFEEYDECSGVYFPRLDVIALEDAGESVKASGSITLSASGAGTTVLVDCTLDVNIGGKDVSVACTKDDEILTTIANALAAAINAADLPITASNTDGVVALENNNGGTVGNNTTIKVSGLSKVSGSYYLSNIQVATAEFTSGATDPTLTSLLDVAAKVRYQTLNYPYEYGTDLATDFLDSRFNVANAIKDGAAILKMTDAKADILVALALPNSQSLVIFCNKETTDDNFVGGEDLELDYVASARVSAIRALRRTEGCNIVNITPAADNAPLDAFGGGHIASLPYFNTPTNSPLQPEGEGWTDDEVTDLETAGGSVMGNNVSGSGVILGNVITTYKTDAAGNADTTWKYLNSVDVMSVSAEYIFTNAKLDFVQSRLTAGNIVRGYNMINERVFIANLQEYYLALANIALVPKSKAALDFFTDSLSIVVNTVTGKITSSADFPIVVQLRQVIVNLKTNFSQSLV